MIKFIYIDGSEEVFDPHKITPAHTIMLNPSNNVIINTIENGKMFLVKDKCGGTRLINSLLIKNAVLPGLEKFFEHPTSGEGVWGYE